MPVYVMLSSLTDEGAKTIKKHPVRISEVNNELEAMGIKVLSQYATLGQFDFITVVEASDNVTIAKASLEMGSRGTIRIQTLAAVAIDELIANLD
jgi:uncharacterized protein with GYD domain